MKVSGLPSHALHPHIIWVAVQYADGKHKVWDAFLDQIEPYASRVPYQIAIGNHEYGYNSDEKHRHNKAVDPSGRNDPYQPDWGNFGGAHCHLPSSCL